ncbi:MAG TPA: VanZ family protein [Chryseolinea sp.]|nr:VanZ family protein [Chryseolinea sp.]
MSVIPRNFKPGIVWLILSAVAFFLPGSALPDNEWFGKIELDKIVHIGLFAVMVLLWSIPLFHKPLPIHRLTSLLILIPFIFFGYSILVEFIQRFFIPGRSFDLFDILADGIGCGVGFLFVKQYRRYWASSK